MSPKTAKFVWWAVLIVESAVLAAFLLGDFGIISIKINPLSFRGIVNHIIAVGFIIVAVIRLRELKK